MSFHNRKGPSGKRLLTRLRRWRWRGELKTTSKQKINRSNRPCFPPLHLATSSARMRCFSYLRGGGGVTFSFIQTFPRNMVPRTLPPSSRKENPEAVSSERQLNFAWPPNVDARHPLQLTIGRGVDFRRGKVIGRYYVFSFIRPKCINAMVFVKVINNFFLHVENN